MIWFAFAFFDLIKRERGKRRGKEKGKRESEKGKGKGKGKRGKSNQNIEQKPFLNDALPVNKLISKNRE